jgi:hypothetical protein
MPVRLKTLRIEERRINSVNGLMEMFHLNQDSNNSNQYQQSGASNVVMDPKTQKIKCLAEMFHLSNRFQ